MFLMVGSGLFAQTPLSEVFLQKSNLGIYVGGAQVKEYNLHPKVHSGIVYGLEYSRRWQKIHAHVLDVEAGFSKQKTQYEEAAVSPFVQLSASYSYLIKVQEASEPLSFYAGPQVGVYYKLGHYPNWDDSHLYWADNLSAGVSGMGTYRAGSGLILLRTSLPVLSLVSRPERYRPYKIDDVSVNGILRNMNSSWEPAFLTNMRGLKSEIEYRYPINPRYSQSIGYRFQYLYMNAGSDSPFVHLQHSLTLKMNF